MMAKCRITPVNKFSIPQIKLNAAVLSKLGRLLRSETEFDFERVLKIVDA